MNAVDGTVVGPATHVIVDRTARRQVLGQGRPLTARRQDIHQAVDDLALDNGPLVTAPLGRGNQRANQRPLVIRQVAGIA
jgi:hypothetical protein